MENSLDMGMRGDIVTGGKKRWVNLQVLYLYFGGAIVIFNSNLYDCKLTESKIILFNCQ